MGSVQSSTSNIEGKRKGFEGKIEQKKDVDCYDARSQLNEKSVFTKILIIG
jgi:hypothetical protein